MLEDVEGDVEAERVNAEGFFELVNKSRGVDFILNLDVTDDVDFFTFVTADLL